MLFQAIQTKDESDNNWPGAPRASISVERLPHRQR